MRVVPGVRIELNYNSGISFGRLAGAGCIVVVAGRGGRRRRHRGAVSRAAALPPRLGVILGGAVGNLIDRFRFGGAVVDYIAV